MADTYNLVCRNLLQKSCVNMWSAIAIWSKRVSDSFSVNVQRLRRFWENDDSSNDGLPNVDLPTTVCLMSVRQLCKFA